MPKFLLNSASPENEHKMPALDSQGSPIMTLCTRPARKISKLFGDADGIDGLLCHRHKYIININPAGQSRKSQEFSAS